MNNYFRGSSTEKKFTNTDLNRAWKKKTEEKKKEGKNEGKLFVADL
jgi:hypothetical protein